jgi:hypothetical protein
MEDNVSTTTVNPSTNGANPIVPLSPEQFGDPASSTGPLSAVSTAPDPTALSASDRSTLQSAIDLIKAARADAASRDAKVAAGGTARLQAVVSYLVGFFDSRGLVVSQPVSPGLDALFGKPVVVSLDAAVGNLQTGLEAMLAAPDTRLARKTVAAVLDFVGDCLISIGSGLAK